MLRAAPGATSRTSGTRSDGRRGGRLARRLVAQGVDVVGELLLDAVDLVVSDLVADEVTDLADRISILRSGRVVRTVARDQASVADLLGLMAPMSLDADAA